MQEREEPAQGEKGEQLILFGAVKISKQVKKKYVIVSYIYVSLHAITDQI